MKMLCLDRSTQDLYGHNKAEQIVQLSKNLVSICSTLIKNLNKTFNTTPAFSKLLFTDRQIVYINNSIEKITTIINSRCECECLLAGLRPAD